MIISENVVFSDIDAFFLMVNVLEKKIVKLTLSPNSILELAEAF